MSSNNTLAKSRIAVLGYGNFILALNTLFNAEVLAEYGVLFDMDADSLARTMQHYEDHSELAATFRARAPQRIREAYTESTAGLIRAVVKNATGNPSVELTICCAPILEEDRVHIVIHVEDLKKNR